MSMMRKCAGTIGQARSEALKAQRTFYQDCRLIYDKSQALAGVMGSYLAPARALRVDGAVPASI